MRKKMFTVTAVVVAAVVMPLMAAVTWDTTTGIGFVGKGDVQLALNYNNKQMQAASNNLIFNFTDEATYAVTCVKEWETGSTRNRTLHTDVKARTRTRAVATTVSYEPRSRNQVNGYWLTGFTSPGSMSGEMPSCPSGFRAFDRTIDFDINNDGFVVTCQENGPCTFTDANGVTDSEKGPFVAYSEPTLVSASGGLLTVKDTVNGLPSLVWPIPVVVTP